MSRKNKKKKEDHRKDLWSIVTGLILSLGYSIDKTWVAFPRRMCGLVELAKNQPKFTLMVPPPPLPATARNNPVVAGFLRWDLEEYLAVCGLTRTHGAWMIVTEVRGNGSHVCMLHFLQFLFLGKDNEQIAVLELALTPGMLNPAPSTDVLDILGLPASQEFEKMPTIF